MATRITIDNSIVSSHRLYNTPCPDKRKGGVSKCGKKLNDISEGDYKKRCFDDDILCLDIDSYEASLGKQQEDPTMDAAIGVIKDKSTPTLMLVELRMNYKSPSGKKAPELIAKLRHSKQLLIGNDPEINPTSYFVYNDKFYELYRSQLENMLQEKKALSKAKATSVSLFNERFKVAEM